MKRCARDVPYENLIAKCNRSVILISKILPVCPSFFIVSVYFEVSWKSVKVNGARFESYVISVFFGKLIGDCIAPAHKLFPAMVLQY